MSKAVLKVFVIAIMFVAFLAQGTAFNSSFSVDVSNESANEQSYILPNHSHSIAKLAIKSAEKFLKQHQENNHAPPDCIDIHCCSIDCCDVDCVCAAGSCSSLMYLNNEIAKTLFALFNETSVLHLPKQTKSITSDPYRPPIFNV